MQLSKIGGGVAVNLSKLRGRGEPIKGVEGAAKGIMPVLKLMEDAFSYADQMGQRKGSGAGYYNIFGWDVMEFLDSKKINADEKTRLKTLSIGLIVPNKFYQAGGAESSRFMYSRLIRFTKPTASIWTIWIWMRCTRHCLQTIA